MIEPADLLDDFRVPGLCGVYVLGCYDRRVTFHAQQVRALNLVDALCRTGAAGPAASVLVVGGGLAGVTAAIAAAVRGCRVRCVERGPRLLGMLQGSSSRHIHPRIYDWPRPGWDDADARLPILNWRADTAGAIAKSLDAECTRHSSEFGRRLQFSRNIASLETDATGARPRASWPQVGTLEFDAVILAVGFGGESTPPADVQATRYWDDDDVLGNRDGERRWLVSGCGDGGLIDLLRVRLSDFRHESTIADLLANVSGLPDVEARLVDIEADPRHSDAVWLNGQYLDIDTPELDERLRKLVRHDRDVVLNSGAPVAIQARAAVLNRFLVSRFLDRQPGDPLSLDYRMGNVEILGRRDPRGRGAFVRIGGREETFDRLILRWGPEPSLRRWFPEIDRLANAPLSAAAQQDRTRNRNWEPGAFGPEAPPLPPRQPARPQPARQAWLEFVVREFALLDLKGLSGAGQNLAIELDRVYVELQGEPDRPAERDWDRRLLETDVRAWLRAERVSGDEAIYRLLANDPYALRAWHGARDRQGRPFVATGKPAALSAVMRAHRRVVILGDPGCGKTTLLRFLALRHARALLAGAAEASGQAGPEGAAESLGPARFPIYLKIAAYASKRQAAPGLMFPAFLRQWAEETQEGLDQVVQDALARGAALVLLDGLDEVTELGERQEIARQIESWVAGATTPDLDPAATGNQVVITSRNAGYKAAPLREHIEHYTVLELSDEAIAAFLHRWCRAVEDRVGAERPSADRARRAAEQEERLRSALMHPRVRRLAVNPLMLTLLALLQRLEVFPRLRVDIYREATRTLAETWRPQTLTETKVLGVLGPIADWLHTNRPLGLLSRVELDAQARRALARWEGFDPEDPPGKIAEAASSFVGAVNRDSGLLLARGEGLFGFAHLTFQEYFVARHVASSMSRLRSALDAHLADPRWREPLVLAIAHISKEVTEEIGPVLLHVIDVPVAHEQLLRRRLLFVLGALADCAHAPIPVLQQITRAAIAAWREAAGPRPALARRVSAGIAGLRDSLLSDGVEGVLVDAVRAEPDALDALVFETRWWSAEVIDALCRSSHSSRALTRASSEAPDLFPRWLGVRAAAHENREAWDGLVADALVRVALVDLLVRHEDKTALLDGAFPPESITRASPIDDALAAALRSTDPRGTLSERARAWLDRAEPKPKPRGRGLFASRPWPGSGLRIAVALGLVVEPESKRDVARAWIKVAGRSTLRAVVDDMGGPASRRTLPSLAVTPLRASASPYAGIEDVDVDEDFDPSEWEEDPDDREPDDYERSVHDELTDRDALGRLVRDLLSEDDGVRGSAEDALERQRRASDVGGPMFEGLVTADEDAGPYGGTVLATAISLVLHDDATMIQAWITRATEGDEAALAVLANVRRASPEVVRVLADAVPTAAPAVGCALAQASLQLRRERNHWSSPIAELDMLIAASLGHPAEEVVAAGARALTAGPLCGPLSFEALVAALHPNASPQVASAAGFVGGQLRAAHAILGGTEPPAMPESAEAHALADRLRLVPETETFETMISPAPEAAAVAAAALASNLSRLDQALSAWNTEIHSVRTAALLRVRAPLPPPGPGPWLDTHLLPLAEEPALALNALLAAGVDECLGWDGDGVAYAAAAAALVERWPHLLAAQRTPPVDPASGSSKRLRPWLALMGSTARATPALLEGETGAEIVAPLVAAAGHEHDWSARQLAIHALGRLRHLPGAVGSVLLKGSRDVQAVRDAVKEAAPLFHSFEAAALDALLSALVGPSDRAAVAAARAVQALAGSRQVLADLALQQRIVDALAAACTLRPVDAGPKFSDAETAGDALYEALLAVSE